jgi:hypothetical protein
LKDNLYILIILTFVLFSLSCRKKIFRHVTIKGTLIDYFNNRPIPSDLIFLGYTGNKKYSEETMNLKTASTDDQGVFEIKTRAAKTGEYILNFRGKTKDPLMISLTQNNNLTPNNGTTNKITIKDGQTLDLGQIQKSKHTFFCVITLNNNSGNPYDFFAATDFNSIFAKSPFPTTPGTKILHFREYTKEEFEKNNHNYILNYQCIEQNSSNQSGGSVTIPILNNDTVFVTINY